MAEGGVFEIRQVQTASSGATRHGHFSQTFLQVGQRARASGGVVGYVFTDITLPATEGADDVYYVLLLAWSHNRFFSALALAPEWSFHVTYGEHDAAARNPILARGRTSRDLDSLHAWTMVYFGVGRVGAHLCEFVGESTRNAVDGLRTAVPLPSRLKARGGSAHARTGVRSYPETRAKSGSTGGFPGKGKASGGCFSERRDRTRRVALFGHLS